MPYLPGMKPVRTRRQFVAAAAAALAATTARAQSPARETRVMHHVFFWLQEPDNQAHISQLMEGLRALAAIPQVQQLIIGNPASTEKREVVDNSWQVSELMYFRSVEDQAAYQVHPIHKAFVEIYSPLFKKVQVYDVAVAG
jgi:hypothetical protein